jgi:hypothetical protein
MNKRFRVMVDCDWKRRRVSMEVVVKCGLEAVVKKRICFSLSKNVFGYMF